MNKLIIYLAIFAVMFSCACSRTGTHSTSDYKSMDIYKELSGLNKALTSANSKTEIEKILTANTDSSQENKINSTLDEIFPEVMQSYLDGENPTEAVDSISPTTFEIANSPELSALRDSVLNGDEPRPADSGEATLEDAVIDLFGKALVYCSAKDINLKLVYNKYMSVISKNDEISKDDKDMYNAVLSVELSAFKFWGGK